MTNENSNVFEPVSGHHDHIWYGPTYELNNYRNNLTSDNIHFNISSHQSYVRTVCKQTTAWEVLWYIFFTLARLSENKKQEELEWKNSFGLHKECFNIIEAVRGLLPFVTTLFRLELPQSLLSEAVLRSCTTNCNRVTIQRKRNRKRKQDKTEDASLESEVIIVFDVSNVYTHHCADKDQIEITNTLCMLCNELWSYANQITEYDPLFENKHCVICIDDITSHFTLPSVMDIKLGKIRYAPSTPSEKIARIRTKEAKYTICISANKENEHNNSNCISLLGLRICGARYVHRDMETKQSDNEKEIHHDSVSNSDSDSNNNKTKNKWLCYTKEDGYAVSRVKDVERLINAFFAASSVLTDLTEALYQEENQMTWNIKAKVNVVVQALVDFFTSTTTTGKGKLLLQHMAFVSSSLLIVYDSCPSHAKLPVNVNSSSDVNVRVLLIDFARCSLRRLNYSEEEVGFVHGLQMFSSLLAWPAS